MATFTIRVELHKASAEDYRNLHEKMQAHGFSKIITASSGVTYQLPEAEYTYSSISEDESQVANKAQRVASDIRRDPGILVTKSSGRAVRGLITV